MRATERRFEHFKRNTLIYQDHPGTGIQDQSSPENGAGKTFSIFQLNR